MDSRAVSRASTVDMGFYTDTILRALACRAFIFDFPAMGCKKGVTVGAASIRYILNFGCWYRFFGSS